MIATTATPRRVTTAEPDQLADVRLRLMGTRIRIVVGRPATPGLPTADEAAAEVAAMLADYDARLSRFRTGSEICALNADPRRTVPASALLRSAIAAALEAAEHSGGLVDPACLDALEAAGYRESWDGARRVGLGEALAAVAQPRRPAAPHPDFAWTRIEIDDRAGTITRPPGMRLDTGGSGKGHAADLASAPLTGYEHWAVDVGGDVRLGGTAGLVRDVEIEDPFTGGTIDVLRLRAGAVATSGVRSRIWRDADGVVGHHLLDPAGGLPAFTGLVAATALAPTAVEAEALAKAAILAGPSGALRVLARHGGLTVDEDGAVARIGRLEPAPRVRLRRPAGARGLPTGSAP
ncbi:MAG: FAD:protein FMN transferase [Solirubrobacteraceae bacterium]|nr:FAD:protein FMN transferase [Solirubrobacteraceae bacterium]